MSRSDRTNLPARTTVAPAAAVRVLDFADRAAEPRVVDIGSLAAKPFRAIITWSASGAHTGKAHVSVATGTRVCIVAKELHVDVQNMHNTEHEVVCMVGDGVVPSKNYWEEEIETAPTLQGVTIPPHALTVRLDPADSAASGQIRLLNGRGVLMVRCDWNQVPPGGLPIGGASVILVTCSHPCRVVYELSL